MNTSCAFHSLVTLYAFSYFMSMTVRSFVIIFRRLMPERSVRKNSFALEIPVTSRIFVLVKSKMTFADCLSAVWRLCLIVCLLLPSGDFSSQRTLVFRIYKSGVLLMPRRIKIMSLLKYSVRKLAIFFSCGRGLDMPVSS